MSDKNRHDPFRSGHVIEQELEKRHVDIEFDVVRNPEFLKEGAAVDDFLKPDRIIVGADSKRAVKMMRRLYAPFSRNHDKMLFMNVRDTEMTKYAANFMLATKISFMNEISNICDRLGVKPNVNNLPIGAITDVVNQMELKSSVFSFRIDIVHCIAYNMPYN